MEQRFGGLMRRVAFLRINPLCAGESCLDLCSRYTPLVEPFGNDSIYLDLSGCGEARVIIRAIARELYASGLVMQAGLASSKASARMAISFSPGLPPAPPSSFQAYSYERNRLVEILPGKERDFIASLPLDYFFLSPKALKKLMRLGFSTIEELKGIPRAQLAQLTGENPDLLALKMEGADPDPVIGLYPPSRISYPMEIGGGAFNLNRLDAIIKEIAAELESLLERSHCGCLLVKLEARSGSDVIARERHLSEPCRRAGQLNNILLSLWPQQHPDALDGILISLQKLSPLSLRQPDLFLNRTSLTGAELEYQIEDLIDNLELRFPGALYQGLAIDRREQILALWDPWRSLERLVR